MDRRLDYLLRRPWYEVDLPVDVAAVPTMLSAHERRLLYTLARDYASGDGAIVDAGCFLGGSTVALLAGLRDRKQSWQGPPLASYDRFVTEAYTLPLFFADDPGARVGRSFRSLFDANVAAYDVPHVVYEGDITRLGWSGGPIEVLFLDVLKSWKVNDAVLRDFFPCLVPGRSVIVQQDYGWGGMPWIPITMELIRDSVRLVDAMEAGSHVFYVVDETPSDVVERGVRNIGHDEKVELIDRAVDASEGWARGMLEIARAMLVADRDGPDAALRDLAAIGERYADHPFVLACLAYVRDGLRSDWSVAGKGHGERLAASGTDA